MKHDPFYQKIVEGLSKPLDPDNFEQCASDVLRSDFPTLVPIRGGTDSGMDGAVADAKGESFPLICTIGTDVIGNLTHNLETYLSTGGPRRKMILATTQALTAKRRKNLQDRARKKGCSLVQIYDQAAIADRLYRRPEWCRDLLGLTGSPPALSQVPLSNRPLLGTDLIGRSSDHAWLKAIDGDSILLGQPGSGKTFLLHYYGLESEARFVVSEDHTEIATALRDQQPKALIVDDAHLKLDLLTFLIQLRTETGIPFAILACCWPGQRDIVQQTLNISNQRIRELKLLTRDEIVEIIKNAGVLGPNPLIADIVDQAEGRPGLAITLAYLCLNGDVQDVALGTALSRSIRTTFEPLVGKASTELLATIALGGDAGLPMATAAHYLGLPLVEVRRMTGDLAAGGAIIEVGPSDLAVRPPALRFSLVRDTFFSGARSLPIGPILGEVTSLKDATLTFPCFGGQ